jgi:lactoylglutathione lyase
MRINHIALFVRDLEVMKTFYVKFFKAKAGKLYQNPKTGLETYFLKFDDGCRLEIMKQTKPGEGEREPNNADYVHVAFSAGSKNKVDELVRNLENHGYKILREPRTTGDGYYESVIIDPENNAVEVVE